MLPIAVFPLAESADVTAGQGRRTRGPAVHATNWTRKALLGSFEPLRPLLPLAVLGTDWRYSAPAPPVVLLATGIALKLVGTLIVTAGIVRLFMVGHDTCHGSSPAASG